MAAFHQSRPSDPLMPEHQFDSDAFYVLSEEYATSEEDAVRFVRFECPGVRLEFMEELK